MVKRALISFLLFTLPSYGAVYQIDVVKERELKLEKPRFFVYKVKRGDTLLKIMKKFKIPRGFLYEIVKVNKLKSPNLIYVGQKLKLPAEGELKKKEKTRKVHPSEKDFKFLKTIGTVVKDNGILFTDYGKVNLRKTPIIETNGKRFIVDLSGQIGSKMKRSLESAGFTVVGRKELEKLIDKVLSENFSSITKNGELILGEKDILIYKYDFMGYNKFTGQRTVINREADTPPALEKILNAYGIAVIQPPYRKLDTDEGNGKLKIVKGKGIEKINAVMKILTGKRGIEKEEGLFFPGLNLYVVYDFIDPEEKVKLELQGNKVVVLSGNFLQDIQNILTLVPFANKELNLILYEPPLSKGKRSTFRIEGLLVSTPKEDWFLIDSVDKPEEIPYLVSRGVNVIVY